MTSQFILKFTDLQRMGAAPNAKPSAVHIYQCSLSVHEISERSCCQLTDWPRSLDEILLFWEISVSSPFQQQHAQTIRAERGKEETFGIVKIPGRLIYIHSFRVLVKILNLGRLHLVKVDSVHLYEAYAKCFALNY